MLQRKKRRKSQVGKNFLIYCKMFADKLYIYIYIDSLCIVKIIRINNCGFNWLRINTSKLNHVAFQNLENP